MEESRWQKHITWDDPEEIEARYKELSSKFDKGINPFSFSEFKLSQGLKHEDLSFNEDSSQRPPSRVLQKKHEKIVNDMKEVSKSNADLHWSDIITHVSVQEFLKQYFAKNTKILTNEFLGYLEFEFPNLVNSLEVRDKLLSLLSVDRNSKYVSLNALEVATREFGLEEMIQNVAFDVEDSMKESKAVIHEQILKELTEAQEILESRKADLDKREAGLVARETKVLRAENKMMVEFREKIEKMAASAKEKVAKEVNAQMRRLQGLERNVNDLVKLARNKQQTLTRSELSVKSTAGDNASKYKARISSLEKSNEVLKTKLSILELETKSDKSTIQKLNDELSRLRARSSMLEQSLSSSSRRLDSEKQDRLDKSSLNDKSNPSDKSEIQAIKEEPEKKQKIVYESGIFISLLSTIIKCCKLTLPVIQAPGSPRSVSQRLSIIEEDLNLGEVFFPAFNKIVPNLIESFPFIHKHKNKEDQLEILNFLWTLLIYAWSDDAPRGERVFNPNNLAFDACTTVWKQKLAAIKKKVKRKPVFTLFANQLVHKVISFYLDKWIDCKGNKRFALISAFLLVLLAVSQKKVVKGLEFIKDYFAEDEAEGDFDQYVHVLVHLLDAPDETSNLSCQILLSLTANHLPQVISQCSNESTLSKLSESCKKALISGQKLNTLTDYEESLIVVLQKLSSNEFVQAYLKSQNLLEILSSRAQSSISNSFFKNNLSSIIRNLSN